MPDYERKPALAAKAAARMRGMDLQRRIRIREKLRDEGIETKDATAESLAVGLSELDVPDDGDEDRVRLALRQLDLMELEEKVRAADREAGDF